jgi:hypothetical protein
MQDAFGYVLYVVVLIGVIAAIVSLSLSRRTYEQIGSGGLDMERPKPDAGPPAGSAAALAERDDEIRQMLTARNARRESRGQAPLDIEAELGRLTAVVKTDLAGDPALVAEVRELVEARNRRRARQGKAPLDVEEEVRRQLRELGSG